MKIERLVVDGSITGVDYEYPGATGYPKGRIELATRCGRFYLPIDGYDAKNILEASKRGYKNRNNVKITVEFPVSDIDEARDLLKQGGTSATLAKVLDILERLDK